MQAQLETRTTLIVFKLTSILKTISGLTQLKLLSLEEGKSLTELCPCFNVIHRHDGKMRGAQRSVQVDFAHCFRL